MESLLRIEQGNQQESQPATNEAYLPEREDPAMDNGKCIVDPANIKVSNTFRYDQQLSDTECSEDYDDDPFFEQAQPLKNTRLEEELKDQINTDKKEFGDFTTDPPHLQDMINTHPNQNLKQMSRE